MIRRVTLSVHDAGVGRGAEGGRSGGWGSGEVKRGRRGGEEPEGPSSSLCCPLLLVHRRCGPSASRETEPFSPEAEMERDATVLAPHVPQLPSVCGQTLAKEA